MDTPTRLLDASTAALGRFVPRVLAALAIRAAAWIGARLVRTAALRAGTRLRLDERLHSPGLKATLAGVAGALVWLPALLGTLELQGLLTPVDAMLSRLMGFVPNLFGALVVLGVGLPVLTEMLASTGAALVRLGVAGVIVVAGLTLASMAAQAITARAPRNAPLLAWTARGAILVFAAALALHQAGLPAQIVTIAFAAVVGGIAPGLAVAIGMGGHPVAGRVLDRVAASFEAPAATEAPAASATGLRNPPPAP